MNHYQLPKFPSPYAALQFLEDSGIKQWSQPGVPLEVRKYRRVDLYHYELKRPSYSIYDGALPMGMDVAKSNIIEVDIPRLISEMVLYFRFHTENIKPIRKFLDMFTCDEDLMRTISEIPDTAQFIFMHHDYHPKQQPSYYRFQHKTLLVEKFHPGSGKRSGLDASWNVEPALPLISFELMKKDFNIFPVRLILGYVKSHNMRLFKDDTNEPRLTDTTKLHPVYGWGWKAESDNEFMGLDLDHDITEHPFCVRKSKIDEYKGLVHANAQRNY